MGVGGAGKIEAETMPGDSQEHKMVTASSSLKEYLRRYESNTEEEKKKKKKTKKSKADVPGVVLVDEDPIWQKQVNPDEDENDESADEEKPQIDEDIEVKRMKRLEQLRIRRPIGVIDEDGSGWVPVSEAPKKSDTKDREFDMSPPRRMARNDLPSSGPESGPSTIANTDLSPPRKQRARRDTPSPDPERKPSSREDGDLSPPRKRSRARYDTPLRPDLGTVNSGREVVDLSPLRLRHHRQHSPPPERGSKASRIMAVDSDLSPRRYHKSAQDDLGTSRAGDLSPPRKSRKHRSPTSRQPVDEDEGAVSDLSPPRRRQKESPKQQPKTGLVTGRDVKEEVTKTKREEWLRFKEMDASVSGRGAEPVYRDKITGKRMSKEDFLKSQKKEKDEKPKEIKLEWGKGLAQKREAEAKLKELELEKEKPFARSRDDPDLDRMLKERVRWGDPFAHLVKKKHLEPVLPNLGDDEKVKESGFIIPQEIPSHSWIRRGLHAPPNRYDIKPGRHWDGVDRSNGYEKELFKRMNEKQATEREAYLWSVADM